MKIQPTLHSRKEIFDSVLRNYYYTPLSDDGDVLNHYDKAMEYLTSLPVNQKIYHSWSIHDRDPDVNRTLEVILTDNDMNIWLYVIPYDKNFTRTKITLTENELYKKLKDL